MDDLEFRYDEYPASTSTGEPAAGYRKLSSVFTFSCWKSLETPFFATWGVACLIPLYAFTLMRALRRKKLMRPPGKKAAFTPPAHNRRAQAR